MGLPDRAAAPREVPCLALRGAVVFPGAIAPLLVGRERSRRAVERAARDAEDMLLVCQRDKGQEEPSPGELCEIGTLARVRSVSEGPDGVLRVTFEGRVRARAVGWPQTAPFLVAAVQTLPDAPGADDAIRRQLIARYRQLGQPSDGPLPASLGRLCDVIAARVLDRFEERQKVLESIDVQERSERLHRFLIRQSEVRAVERRVDSRVRRQIQRAQREFYLHEQLRAIREELGEPSEAEELRGLLRGRRLPEAVAQRVERELKRLDRLPPLSAEAGVARTYVEWLLALPWDARTEEQNDLAAAQAALDARHEGLEKVKERIVEHLATRRLVERFQGPILCLVGPPGTGKTSIARSIAHALGRRLARSSLGGVRDEAEIRGHRRTYVGAAPGRIIRGLRQAQALNPVFLLDEVDKLAADLHGDPAAALLEVLDPNQNAHFSDHYIEVPFDLSEVLFITTANSLRDMPRPLLDRLEVVPVPGYSEEEKLRIARRHLLPCQMEVHGIGRADLSISPAALQDIVRRYTFEAGVRGLERNLASLCRKAARRRAAGAKRPLTVSRADLPALLGRPPWTDPGPDRQPRVGAAVGLGRNEAGGSVLALEVAVMAGRGQLRLTGRLGEVMRESAEAAFSYVRANARALGLGEGFHEGVDVHVHVPGAAVPKDGPSAGVAVAAALVSALTGTPLRPDVALTGEVTLLGRVLPVGAIREKVLAARRAGMRAVVLPAANRGDWEELPAAVRRSLRPVFVEALPQALEAALEAPLPVVLA